MSIEWSLPTGDKGDWERIVCALVKSDHNGDPFALLALLQWLQDMNWPGADTARDHLRSAGRRIFSLVLEILHTKDYSWQYNVITGLVAYWPRELQADVAPFLERLAGYPSQQELDDGVDIASAMVLCKSRLLPLDRLKEIALRVLRNNSNLNQADAKFFGEYAK